MVKNKFVYKHPFEETTISACGYLFGVHPYHVHRDTVVSLLNNLASDKKLAFHCVMRQKSLGSGKKEDNNNTKPATNQTSVLELQCPTSLFHDSIEFLSGLDTCLYYPGSTYIPENYGKHTNKASFQLALSQHHSEISNHMSIPIEGLHPDAARDFDCVGQNLPLWLNENLNQRNDPNRAFISIQPTAQTDSKGRWFIITSTHMYDTTGFRLDKKLIEMHEHINAMK